MILALFSGREVHATTRPVSDFHPVVVAFGGVKLDLTQATFQPGTTNLAIAAAFGGVEVWLPADVGLYAEGLTVFGGREIDDEKSGGVLALDDYQSANYGLAERRLNLVALGAFGGLSVHRVPVPATAAGTESGTPPDPAPAEAPRAPTAV